MPPTGAYFNRLVYAYQGPLMLEMGILPDVAAATSATMIMFTAAAASAVYISFGNVKCAATTAARSSCLRDSGLPAHICCVHRLR